MKLATDIKEVLAESHINNSKYRGNNLQQDSAISLQKVSFHQDRTPH